MLNEKKSRFTGNPLFIVVFIVVLNCTFISAQENLFEKTSITEKLERYKRREALKNWELVLLKSDIVLSKITLNLK